jgi:Male sterility protein
LIAARTLTAPLPVLKWLTQVWSGEKRMRIFVTGGPGFLGSRMIRTLVSQRHEVFALARSTPSGERIRTLLDKI